MFVLSRKALQRIGAFPTLTQKMPFQQCHSLAHILGSLFDRFQAPIAYRYRKETVINWFKAASLAKIESRDLFGHVVWGYKEVLG